MATTGQPKQIANPSATRDCGPWRVQADWLSFANCDNAAPELRRLGRL
jgi:hypothetical protein